MFTWVRRSLCSGVSFAPNYGCAVLARSLMAGEIAHTVNHLIMFWLQLLYATINQTQTAVRPKDNCFMDNVDVSPTAPLKSGFKTSEGIITLVLQVVAMLDLTGTLGTELPTDQAELIAFAIRHGILGVMALVSLFRYTGSRTMLKARMLA